jgi:O-antigen/teichoic acid export membrane protein
MPHENHGQISGDRIARNSLYNIAGFLVPLFISIAALPFIKNGLGIERFGIILLSWTVVGYFTIFDLGISRATTRFVAHYLGSNRDRQIPELVWSSLIMMTVLGLLAFLTLALLTPWLVRDIFSIDPELLAETEMVFYLLAISIPLLLLTAVIRGVFEGQQRFGIINAIKVPASLVNYAIPLILIIFTQRVDAIVLFLVIGRGLVLVVHFVILLRTVEGTGRMRFGDATMMKELLVYGGWMSVSRIVSPVMVYMDRFFVASYSMVAATYYLTPFELINRFMAFTHTLLNVLFPALSSISEDYDRLIAILPKLIRFTTVFILPISLAVITVSDIFLAIWLGEDFAVNSTTVLQILCIGVMLNALAQIPFNIIQAAGRTDLTAILHLVELPIYITVLVVLLPLYGIVGAALAWSLRTGCDALALFVVSYGLTKRKKAWSMGSLWPSFAAVVVSTACIFLITMIHSLVLRIALTVIALGVVLPYLYFGVLTGSDRQQLKSLIPGFSSRDNDVQ